MGDVQSVKFLWKHPHPEATRTNEFKIYVEKKHHLSFSDYDALRQWSIDEVSTFWEDVWHFTGVNSSQEACKVNSLEQQCLNQSVYSHSIAILGTSPRYRLMAAS